MKNNAKIEVEGPCAQGVAGSVLDSLSLDPCEVRSMTVSIHTLSNDADCTKKTETSFETHGPDAGAVAAQMIGGIDNGKHDATYINVEVTAVNETDSADEVADSPEEPDASDGVPNDTNDVRETEIVQADGNADASMAVAVDRKSSLRAGIEKEMPEDFGTEVSPADECRDLSRGSKKYRALAYLAAFQLNHPEKFPVKPRELAEQYEHWDKNPNHVSSNLSNLFREDGYLRRKREKQDTGGIELYYQMDEAAWDELDRVGWPADMEPVDNLRNGEIEDTLPTIKN